MNHAVERKKLIAETLGLIRDDHLREGVTRDSLRRTADRLAHLAQRRDLFNFETFALPGAGEPLSTRYELQVGDDQEYALYLQALSPGKQSVPHNHGTWVVVCAIEGEEVNRIYRRTDDGTQVDHAHLQVESELTVAPGQPAIFLGDDIHSIHVTGEKPALHFHLYGQALETLTQRLGYDLATGKVSRYNQTQWRPSVKPL